MIRFVEYKNIDKKKWDSFIDKSPNACIFVYSWYLDAVCRNWSALILNDYEAVFPLATKSKYGINYLYQPFFTRYFGAFAQNDLNTSLPQEFLKSIPEKYKYIDFCIYNTHKYDLTGFVKTERNYQLLNLESSYEIIYKGYSDNAKRNIKKADKAGFRIETNIYPELIVNLFRKTKGDELTTIKAENYKTLLHLMNTIVEQNKAESFAVYNTENHLCAAAFLMKNKNRFVYLKGGVTSSGKSNGAMHFLFDFFIRKYAGTPNMLDFGGSSVESVARFYKNFGAKDCVYLQLKKNKLSRIVRWVSKKI